MGTFSERYGYTTKPLVYESMTPELRNRIWNIYHSEVCTDIVGWDSNCAEELLDFFGMPYLNTYDVINVINNIDTLRKWYMHAEWYKVFDFVEVYLKFASKDRRKDAITSFNQIFEWENTGYRIVCDKVTPITNDTEIRCIEKAQATKYDAVNRHMAKAVDLFSRRPKPDYENSIKESISAVEAMCCILTNNKKATLGDALKKLEENGVILHKALKSSMSSLYGYTSDEGGIRHGSIDFAGASSEDAKYMLVSCSAFVNYLIEKWEKAKKTP